MLSESLDAGVASVSNSPHLAPPFIRSYIPAASRPTVSLALPRLRPRGLVNTKNIRSANAVLQLLVDSPPFWDLFRELGDIKEPCGSGVPEIGGAASVDRPISPSHLSRIYSEGSSVFPSAGQVIQVRVSSLFPRAILTDVRQ